jgi:hypothetical protein
VYSEEAHDCDEAARRVSAQTASVFQTDIALGGPAIRLGLHDKASLTVTINFCPYCGRDLRQKALETAM